MFFYSTQKYFHNWSFFTLSCYECENWKCQLSSLCLPLKCFLHSSQGQRLKSTFQLCHPTALINFQKSWNKLFSPLASVNSVSENITNDIVTLIEALYYRHMSKHVYADCSAVSSCHSSCHSFLIDVAYLELWFIRFLHG